ncbi:MAG: methyltransferase domain-containing protein [Pseudomonadota bacterium]
MPDNLIDLLACPRCGHAPLTAKGDQLHCTACKAEFPSVGGLPWMFADAEASLTEWRNRLHMAQQKIGHEIEGLERELKARDIRPLSKRRVERYLKALKEHQRKLKKLVAPMTDAPLKGSYPSYLALRTRLPVDQGLHTYYPNIFRDWCWGSDENKASMDCLRSVLHDNAELGRVLVLGAGAGRLAYDIHREFDNEQVVAMDFNPLLMFVAKQMADGDTLKLYEFPIAPASLEDDAVLRTLDAPEAAGGGFSLVFGDALRAPFTNGSFDTVVTPWLIDIISEDLPILAARINQLLSDNGRWLNFGSLAFASPKRTRCYSPEEVKAIVAEAGFSDPYVSQTTIPYMCSPASRHGRQEKTFTFSAYREKKVKAPARHRALPDWIVTGKEPVPLTQSFRTQAMTTQIYSFIMSLIDGRRSINDMAKVLEQQQLMQKDEAVAAIRSFLTKMHDDSQREGGL